MTDKKNPKDGFPSAEADATRAEIGAETPQTRSASYRLAYADRDFLLRDELRSVRLQLELLKPELILQEHGVESTIVVFGSARLPDPDTADARHAEAAGAAKQNPSDAALRRALARAERQIELSRYHIEARRFAALASRAGQSSNGRHYVVTTGGGGGIMEAANRGADESDAVSIGLNIVLPEEQTPNPYITPELSFQFHYFALRKMHFLMRARALAIFPGGFGTIDELFDALTLIQTGKVAPMPVLLFGRDYWRRLIDFDAMVEDGVISPEDADIITFVETADEAWEIVSERYKNT